MFASYSILDRHAGLALAKATAAASERERPTSPAARRRQGSTSVIGTSPLALLAACGGGGGAGTPPPPPAPSVAGAADSVAITAGTATVTGNVLANDAATGGALAVTAVTGAGGVAGTVGQAMQGSLGTLTIAADGAFTFALADNAEVRALAAGQTATNSFAYTPSVGAVAGTPQTVTVTATGVNDAPIANPDLGAITVGVATTVVGNVRANDTDVDAGATLVVTAVGGGAVGAAVRGTYGSVVINSDGSYTYTLDPADADTGALRTGQSGTETFSYTISDGSLSNASTLSITVNGADDAPIAQSDAAAITAGAATNTVSGNLLANDSDPDAGTTLSVSRVDGGTIGTARAGTFGSVIINADGSYTYSLNNSAVATRRLLAGETATESFAYTITDGTLTSTSSLTITVTGVNDAPVAVNDTDFNVYEDGIGGPSIITGNVLTNDSDPDGDSFRVLKVDGTYIPHRMIGEWGRMDMNPDGSFTYYITYFARQQEVIDAVLAGERRFDRFEYEVIDSSGAVATATVTITINGSADFPSGTTQVSETINVSGTRTFAAGEKLGKAGSGVLVSSGSVNDIIVNNGQLRVEWGGQGDARIYSGSNLETFTNNGLMEIKTVGAAATGYYSGSWGMLINYGDLIVSSVSGSASAYTTWNPGSGSWSRTVTEHLNSGLIYAHSGSGVASGMSLVNGGRVFNDPGATIDVAGFGATGITFGSHGGSVLNQGLISVSSSNPMAPGVGINGPFGGALSGSGGGPLIDNQGTIRAEIAIRSQGNSVDFVRNSGLIEGRIELGGGDDRLLNSGTIRGNLSFGDGNDLFEFDVNSGHYTGVADGGNGTDTLRLIDNVGMNITSSFIDVGQMLDNFERIDVAGTGNTTLQIRVSDVLDATGAANQLMIDGAAGDRVDIDAGWAQQSSQTVDGTIYNVYTNGDATLMVHVDMLVI